MHKERLKLKLCPLVQTPDTCARLGATSRRASQLYSLMDIYLLGMCWALYKRRALHTQFGGWEPLQMVLGGYMNSMHVL